LIIYAGNILQNFFMYAAFAWGQAKV
jgi:hypothetical protein